jgi:indole-3-acetate monooxygenase
MGNDRMKLTIPHAKYFISEAKAEALRKTAAEAESMKTLHEIQLSTIRDQNWFNIYVPRAWGGLELSFPEILRTQEGIAWADGSSAWVVTLCSGAAWFIGFLDSAVATDIFGSKYVCLAGSGAVAGTANRTSAGYEITGMWPYATGSLLATAFTVNCFVQENGVPVYKDGLNPLVNAFVLMPGEVKIHRTWHGMGMVATGSHSIEVQKIVIPYNRAFVIHPEQAILPDPIFRYPFQQLAETTLTINLSGMALRFLDLAENKLRKDYHTLPARQIRECTDQLNKARQVFYHCTDNAWAALTGGAMIPDAMLAEISRVSHNLMDCCRRVVNILYPYCGMDAADTRKEMNLVWRNFYTAGQHNLFHSFSLKENR